MTTQEGLQDIQYKLNTEWTFGGSIESGSYLKPLPYIPQHKTTCLCGHHICDNYYIINKDRTIVEVVGSKCIKKFTGGLLKTCEKCGDPHQNRKFDLCNTHKAEAQQAIKKANNILNYVLTDLVLVQDQADSIRENIIIEERRRDVSSQQRDQDLINMINNPKMKEPDWLKQLRIDYRYFIYN